MSLHRDRKMERAMGTIRAEGDDGGETENGVRDTNTRDTDTYGSLKIESNYRQGAKRKMRRGEKEGMRSEVVMSVNVLWRKKSRARGVKGRCKKNHGELKINCLIYNTLNIDSNLCHTSWLWDTVSGQHAES